MVKQYYWILDSKHNVITKNEDGHRVNMPSLLMGNQVYTHLNYNNSDNRRSNLVSVRGYKNDGKTILNGYIAIYMPEHHRAFDNGCVYEHILVAENMLNRKLKAEECVHHKDHNKQNNKKDNLMVFVDNKHHIYFHKNPTTELKMLDDGAYICIIVDKNICPICGINKKESRASQCATCYKKQQVNDIPQKELLIHSLKINESFEGTGREFGVSGNTVKKWCKRYSIPEYIKPLKKFLKEN